MFLTISTALEITPPAPAKSSATSSGNQNGMRRGPLHVHDCVSFPVFAALDGENVVEDMLRGEKMRDSTKDG